MRLEATRASLADVTGVCGVFVASAALTRFTGVSPLPVAPFPILVALHMARRHETVAAAAVAAAALAGLAGAGSLSAAALYAVAGAVGVPLGWGLRERWTYGRIVAAVAAPAMLAAAMYLWAAWDAWTAQAGAALEAVNAELNTQTGEMTERREALLRMYRGLFEHWASLSVGLLFATLLAAVCLEVSFGAWWVRRRYGAPGPRAGFRDMRPPEWLVWAAIATAVMWYADNRWPGTLLRPVSWNTAVGLAAIYWLNGVAILAYALKAFQPPALVYGLAVFLLVYLGYPAWCLIGFFDTWTEFRVRVDRMIEARKRAGDDSGDDQP